MTNEKRYVIDGEKYTLSEIEGHMAYLNEEVLDPQTWAATRRYMLSFDDSYWMRCAEAILAQTGDQK